MKSKETLREQVLSIAEYLGCNGPELWSELEKLLESYAKDARVDELNTWFLKENKFRRGSVPGDPVKNWTLIDGPFYIVFAEYIEDRIQELTGASQESKE